MSIRTPGTEALPTISVVTATLNAVEKLPGLLASLRGQSDRDFRFLVMDGDSQDGTRAIIEAAADLVTVFQSRRDKGFYFALNSALPLLKTDYYLVMGADDRLHPDAIANYKSWAAREDADIVVANVRAGATLRRGFHPRRSWLGPGHMFTSHSVGTLLRTALHARFGEYPLRYQIYADSLFMKQAALASGTRVTAGDFTAGEFNLQGGFSQLNFVRSLCELWMVQRETGENPAVQYLLFQLRLLRNLRRVVA